jgi:type I restriction enzyme, S subunit
VTDKTPRNSGETIPEKYHIKDGDLIFSWSGTLAVNIWASGPALLNQHLFSVLTTGRVSSAFLLVALREALVAFDNHTVGATMKHIRRSALDRVFVALPDRAIMSVAEESLAPIYRQLVILHQQNRRLAGARDLLLPRLMNGDIAV